MILKKKSVRSSLANRLKCDLQLLSNFRISSFLVCTSLIFISLFIEAHDALHHFSCKMLTPRHCSGSCSFKSPLLPPWTTFQHIYFVWTSTSTHPPKHRGGWEVVLGLCWKVHGGNKTCIYCVIGLCLTFLPLCKGYDDI